MPSQPLQVEDTEKLYQIVVTCTLLGSSWKKIMENFAWDLSQTKWPSGQPMFNVTLISGDNEPAMAKKALKSEYFNVVNTALPVIVPFDNHTPIVYLPKMYKWVHEMIFHKNKEQLEVVEY